MNKKWILSNPHRTSAGESLNIAAELENMMLELKERRVINDTVCTDIFTILYSDEQIEIPDEEKRIIAEEQTREQENRRAIKQQARHIATCKPEDLPSDICGTCRKTIKDMEQAVRCSNLNCQTVTVYYHAQCSGLNTFGRQSVIGTSSAHSIAAFKNQFFQDRREWKCSGCRIDKGKAPAV